MASYEAAKSLLNKGVSRPTLYSVQLPQTFISRQTNDYLNFFATTTAIPEVSTPTAFVSGQENMGIVREQPTGVIFSKPFNMTVIENSDFTIYKDLRRWFDRTSQSANQFNLNRNIRMQYYETYTADMELVKLEQSDTPLGIIGEVFDNSNYKSPLRLKFINAYPIRIGSIELSGSDYDQYTSYEVDFTYESYSVSGPGLTGNIGQLASLVNSFVDIF